MLVKINGASDEVPDACFVGDMLRTRNIPLEVAIITVNGDLVKRESWDSFRLTSHDEVEIIRIIGGG